MLDTQQIFKLCDSYTINIDRNDNNLMRDLNYLVNPVFLVETPAHTFRFRIIYRDKNKKTFQIQCLSTFKILILNQSGELFFEEFFNINNTNINNTIFYGVYDNLAICFFPLTNPNLILCFGEKLFLKSINSDFELDDQTIFLYEELDYKIKILTTNLNYINMDNKNYIYSINNVKNVFEYIFNNYNSLPENIYIQLNSNIIPFDFFYNQQIPTFLDRMFDIQTMTIQKRVYNYKSLLDLDMACPDSKDDYFDKSMSQSVENLLPSRDNIVIIWTKLIMNDIPAPVYYNSSGIYLVSRDNILAKPHSYYQKIVGLLEKKSDQKIFNLFQFALYSIFFS